MALQIPLIGGALAAIGGWFTSLGAAIVAIFTLSGMAWSVAKGFMMFMLVMVLPILLYNIAVMTVGSFMDIAMVLTNDITGADQGELSLVLRFTSLAAWLADNLYLKQALSAYLSAIGAKFVMGFIPLVRI